jgi:hypothetical protein
MSREAPVGILSHYKKHQEVCEIVFRGLAEEICCQ